MATKEEKLAAARKKLKEYQDKTKDSDKTPTPKSEIFSSRSSSRLSNKFENRGEDSPLIPKSTDNSFQQVPLQNIFSNEENSVSNYFKNIDSKSDFFQNQYLKTATPPITDYINNGIQQDYYTEEKNTESLVHEAMEPLQLQLKSHVQTISALMSERNELNSKLLKADKYLDDKNDEVEDLKTKLSESKSKIGNLERALSISEHKTKELELIKDQLDRTLQHERQDKITLLQQYEVKEVELSEIRQKLNQKQQECENLAGSLQQCNIQLSLCQVRIQQLNAATPDVAGAELVALLEDKNQLIQRIQMLEAQLEHSVKENEQSSQNFNTYAQQCNSQIQTLTDQITSLNSTILRLNQENEGYSLKLTSLEKEKEERHLQSSEKQNNLIYLQNRIKEAEDDNSKLQSELQNKILEVETLNSLLLELQNKLEELEHKLEEATNAKEHLIPESEVNKANEKLLAAMESDKVAAARAVSQNVKLKQQLIELQDGFIKLSDGKLELTEKLEYSEHLNQQLTTKIAELEREREKHEHTHHSHDNDHDHGSQDHDHGSHDHDHGSHNHKHSNDEFYSNNVEELKNIIHILENDKIELINRIKKLTENRNNNEHDHDHDHNHSHEDCIHDHNHDLNLDDLHIDDDRSPEETKMLLIQMEEKLKKTYNEVAALDDEKQRLEHLVLQLQGETETIGEYVTLYQRQRMLLRQRAKEKDEQLVRLSQDREELKSKLSALDALVQSMLAEKQKPTFNNRDNIEATDSKEAPNNTADRIRELITEIGSTNLMNPTPVSFEHCNCCSGRLITV